MKRTPFSSKAALDSWTIVPIAIIEEFFFYLERYLGRLTQWWTMTEWATKVLVIISLLLLPHDFV